MVRGVLKDGVIKPIDPLPSDWKEGEVIALDRADPMDDPAAVEAWVRELRDDSTGVTEDVTATVLRAVNEHRREQKDMVGKRMGLE